VRNAGQRHRFISTLIGGELWNPCNQGAWYQITVTGSIAPLTRFESSVFLHRLPGSGNSRSSMRCFFQQHGALVAEERLARGRQGIHNAVSTQLMLRGRFAFGKNPDRRR
jgi:hypothetical protein